MGESENLIIVVGMVMTRVVANGLDNVGGDVDIILMQMRVLIKMYIMNNTIKVCLSIVILTICLT